MHISDANVRLATVRKDGSVEIMFKDQTTMDIPKERVEQMDNKRLDKLEFEHFRVEDAIYGHARKHGLTAFHSEWSTKEYSDSDHNLPNMVFAFLDTIQEEQKKIQAERDKAMDFIVRYYSEAGANAELDARLFLEARQLLGDKANDLSIEYFKNKALEKKLVDPLAIDMLFNAVYHNDAPIEAVPDELLQQYMVYAEIQKKLDQEEE